MQAQEAVLVEAADDAEAWIRRQLQNFRNPERPFEIELRDGTWFRVAQRRTANGGFVVIGTNITELRRRESELRSIGEELRHKTLLPDAPPANMPQGLPRPAGNHGLSTSTERFLNLYTRPPAMPPQPHNDTTNTNH